MGAERPHAVRFVNGAIQLQLSDGSRTAVCIDRYREQFVGRQRVHELDVLRRARVVEERDVRRVVRQAERALQA